MNLTEKLRYLQAKKELEKVNESKLLNEYATEGLFSIFQQPLADIFDALKLSAMDLTNGLTRIIKAIWHKGDPKKLKKDKEEYDRKKAKIMQQWEPIVERSVDAIQSADPFMMFAIAPSFYASKLGVEAAAYFTKGAVEVFAADNWASVRSKYFKWFSPKDEDEDEDKRGGRRISGVDLAGAKTAEEVTKIRKALEDLFYGKEKKKNEGLLREQAYPSSQKNPQEFLEKFLKEKGIQQDINIIADQLIKNKTKLTKDSLDVLVDLVPVAKLIETKDFESFKKVIEEIFRERKLSPDLAKDFKEMIPKIEAQAKEMAESSDLKAKISKSLNKPADQIPKEEFFNQAMNYAFAQSKKSFDQQMGEKIKEFESILQKNDKDITLNSNDLKVMKEKSDELDSIKEFLKVYDQYQIEYKKFKSLAK